MSLQDPVKLQISLPRTTFAWLRAKAATRRDGSMAAVVREAIDQARKEDEAE